MLALFPFEPPLYEAAGIPVTYVGHPLAQEPSSAGTRRAARETLKHERDGAAVRAAAGQPAVRDRDARDARARRGGRASPSAGPTRASSCRWSSRRTRDAFVERAASRRPRCAAADAALRPCGRRAAGGRRCAGRVGHGDARSRARAMSARHLLSRQRADGAHRRGASCCCRTWGCRTCSPDASSCRSSCRIDATPGNLAQAALNLFDDTITRRRTRDAVRADSRRTGDGHRGPGGGRRARRARPRMVRLGAASARHDGFCIGCKC